MDGSAEYRSIDGKLIPPCLRSHFDTTTGDSFSKLADKVRRGIPNLYLCCDTRMAFSYMSDLDGFMPSGSSFDGSGVVQDLFSFGDQTDVDEMREICKPLPVNIHSKVVKYLAQYPVFCILDVTDFPQLQEILPTVKRGGLTLVSAGKFREHFSEQMFSYRPKSLGESKIHTPGVDLVKDNPGSACATYTIHTGQVPASMDLALCIPCEGWPGHARTPSLVGLHEYCREAFPYGFHLVPKCRPNGDPEIEWRLSFSLTENIFIGDKWYQLERALYALLKCLIKRHVRMPHVISTYHLKTVMFWNIELHAEIHQFGMRLISVLDNLLHWVVEGYIPLFFLPQMNLLQGIPETILSEAARKISNLRQHLWTMSNHFDLYNKPFGLSAYGFYKERINMVARFACNHLAYQLCNGAFSELRDLHRDPNAILYIWQSFLYQGATFAKVTDDESLSETIHVATLLANDSQYFFLQVWRDFLLCLEKTPDLLGYRKDENYPTLINKRLGLQTNTMSLYHLDFDDGHFVINSKDWQAGDDKNNSIYLLSPSAQVYYDISLVHMFMKLGIMTANGELTLPIELKMTEQTSVLYDALLFSSQTGSKSPCKSEEESYGTIIRNPLFVL